MSESATQLEIQLNAANSRIVELESQLALQNIERYRSIVENQTELIYRYTSEFILTYVNPAYSSHFGLTPQEMIGLSLLSVIPDEDRPAAIELIRTLTASNQVCISERQTRMSDGSVRWYEWTDRAILDTSGQIGEYQGVARDITKRIQIQDNFNSLDTILAQSRNLVAISDLSGNITYLNNGGATMLGYPSPEIALTKLNILEAHTPEDAKLVLEEYIPLAVQKGEWRGENRLKTCSGELIEVEQTIFALHDREGNLKSYATITVDITEQKRALKALETSEHKYRSLVESFDSNIVMLNKKGDFLFANKNAAERFHLEPETIVGRNIHELMSPEDVARYLEIAAKVIDTGQGIVIELPGTLDEETYMFRTSIQPVLDPSGIPFAILINATNITDLKQAEAAQRESEELLQELMKHLPGTVAILDHKNTLLFCNEFYAKTTGYTREEILGKELKTFLPPEVYAKALTQIEQMLSQKKLTEFGIKDPDSRHWKVILFPIPRQGLPPNIGAIGLDVTREKEAEEVLQKAHDLLELRVKERTAALQRNQADLESIIESTSLSFILCDLEGNIRVVNQHAQEFSWTHYERRPEPGHSMLKFLPLGEHPLFLERLARVRAGESLTFVNVIKKADKTIYVEFRYYPVNTRQGDIIGVNIVFEDITARNETELQLRFLANLQENMLEAVIATDVGFNIKSWNKAAENIYGWKSSEVIGKPLRDIIPIRIVSNETTDEAIQILGEKGFWSGEVVQKHRDGAEINILSSIVLLKDSEGIPTGVLGVNHDITAKKQADIVLEEKRQQELELQGYLKTLHEISVELAAISKLDEFYKKVVQFGLERLGFERLGFLLYDPATKQAIGTYGTDAQGKLVAEHHLQFDPTSYTGIMKQAMHHPDRYTYDIEARLFSNGEYIGMGWNAAVSLWQGSDLLGWLTIDNGVSHKPVASYTLEVLSLYRMTVAVLLANKLVEEKLQSSSQRLKLATHTGGIGIWEFNLSHNILIWDDQMLALYGITRENFTGKPEFFQKAVHPDDWERVAIELRAAVQQAKPLDSEFRIFWPNGVLRHIKSNAIIIGDEEGQPQRLVGVNWDITTLKRSEETLKDALKKEKELGELKTRFISRASHEFRTPLAAILATTETLTVYRNKMTEPQLDARLDKIRQQIMYLKDIMEDVLQLSRFQSGRMDFRPSQGNLDELCQNIVTEFESQEEYKNRIIYKGTNSPLIATFDTRLIRQVISNLVSNALKYSPAKKSVYLDLSQGSTIITLKVRDEGIGIPQEDINSLFEPFQRASNVGTIAGTGLGLSIALQAVEMHNGTISVESELSVGTTFTLTIPKYILKGKENDEDISN